MQVAISIYQWNVALAVYVKSCYHQVVYLYQIWTSVWKQYTDFKRNQHQVNNFISWLHKTGSIFLKESQLIALSN